MCRLCKLLLQMIRTLNSVTWLAGDVKESTHLLKRVGHVVPGVVVSGLGAWAGPSHRVNLIAPVPLRIVQEKLLIIMGKCNKSLSADPYYILIYIITVSYLSSFESVTFLFPVFNFVYIRITSKKHHFFFFFISEPPLKVTPKSFFFFVNANKNLELSLAPHQSYSL